MYVCFLFFFSVKSMFMIENIIINIKDSLLYKTIYTLMYTQKMPVLVPFCLFFLYFVVKLCCSYLFIHSVLEMCHNHQTQVLKAKRWCLFPQTRREKNHRKRESIVVGFRMCATKHVNGSLAGMLPK